MSPLRKRLVYMVAVTLLAMGAASGGVMLWRGLYPPPPMTRLQVPAPATAAAADAAVLHVGDRRPQVSLRDVSGAVRSISEWDGSLLLVNFWATWCPPCLEEIPSFVRLQDRYRDRGVVFLGIALDSPERVESFMTSHGVNYESLHGEKDAIDASKAFGNTYGALPFTAVVGRDGRIVHLQQGILEESSAQQLIERNL